MSTLTIADAAKASGSAPTPCATTTVMAVLEETVRNLELIDWKINLYRERSETT